MLKVHPCQQTTKDSPLKSLGRRDPHVLSSRQMIVSRISMEVPQSKKPQDNVESHSAITSIVRHFAAHFTAVFPSRS